MSNTIPMAVRGLQLIVNAKSLDAPWISYLFYFMFVEFLIKDLSGEAEMGFKNKKKSFII